MEEGISDEPLVFIDGFCPLCCSKRTYFTCSKCIKLGLFYNSRKRSEESFEEKRQRLETIKKLKSKHAERVLQSVAITQSTEKLRCDIQLCRNKVSVLRRAVCVLKEEEVRDRAVLNLTTEENKKRRSGLEELKERIRTQGRESHTRNNEIETKQSNLASELESVARVRRIRVDQIQKYLFPISKQKVFPKFGTPPGDTVINVEASDVVAEASESCEMALTEATRTSYIEGRWVSDDELGNIQYRILETLLPANGDYSAYSRWVRANKNGSSESLPTSNLRNSAFSLTAGLSYTCQLLDLIAYFLDISLPKDLSYSEFCLHELSATEFKSAVSRLNANVMYLCLSQNVNTQMLHPRRTLQNIDACLQSSNILLGRGGPHNVFDLLCPPSEEEEEESSSDDESELGASHELSGSDTEWETVSMETQLPAFLPDETFHSESVRPPMTHTEQQPRQTTTSSLVSSVTSLWPWKS